MRKILQVLFFSFITFLFCSSTLHAISLNSYTVKLEGFNQHVYGQKISHYRLESGSTNFNLINTPFQNIIKKEKRGNSSTLFIKSGILKQEPFQRNKLKSYLRNTRYLNLESEIIKKKSFFIKKSRNPPATAEKMVYHLINKKMTGIPLLPATAILKNHEGDCTEHSVLLVSLLRSAGIPARAVTGMILVKKFAGIKNLFVYHMWVEAYYKNRWIMLDATRPGKMYKNRYIAFCYHNLKTEMPISYIRAVSSIKNFKVFYLK